MGEQGAGLAPAQRRGEEVDRGAITAGELVSDDEIGTQPVGSPGPHPVGEMDVGTSGEQRNAAALLQGQRRGSGGGPGCIAFGVIATARIEVHPAPHHGSGKAAQPLPLPNRFPAGLLCGSGHQAQLRDHYWPTGGVLGHTPVALEVEQSPLGIGSEDAVHFPGVETKGVEAAL